MQVTVTKRHGTFGEGIGEYAEGKVQDAFSLFPRVESVHIILNKEKHRSQVEVVVQAKNHIKIDGHAEEDNMLQAIDEAVDKAAKQLRKERDKIQNHR